jgi:uncharacterized protein YjbI with pentapeptide repeats
MKKLCLLPLSLLYLTSAFAANSPKPCPDFRPSEDKAKWAWMDRDCHVRTRADLDRIIHNHSLWTRKYRDLLSSGTALAAHGAFHDLLRADLSGAQLLHADLTGVHLERADLTSANLDSVILTDAHLYGADLTEADFSQADLTGAFLENADLTGAFFEQFPTDILPRLALSATFDGTNLEGADLTHVYFVGAHLTDASLLDTDLTGAELSDAHLVRTRLQGADLTSVHLEFASLYGADLKGANLTGANLTGADLSGSYLQGTDFSDVDLTGAQLWYATLEPKVPPPVNSIARAEGLRTLRWADAFNERDYLQWFVEAMAGKGPMPHPLSFPERWLVCLAWFRERSGGFPWTLLLGSTQPQRNDDKDTLSATISWEEMEQIDPHMRILRGGGFQNPYPLIDIRNSLKKSGYLAAELEVNLAYKRHTQSILEMIFFDWTCEYGAAPWRPLIIALMLALPATLLYWLGFRHRWFGSQLLLVERRGRIDFETPLGNPLTRPNWREPHCIERRSSRVRLRFSRGLSPLHTPRWLRLRRLLASFGPRLRWEAGFFKAAVFFSLISVVNLGFNGFDFGRWVRMLLFREYDLKARGWLRTVSGLQSLIGLGLLALSILSYFGHPFE